MYLPWNIALGKFGKGPRKGGFTWYFAGQYPPAQIPHLAVDLKAFDQVSCGGNVPMCLCYQRLPLTFELASLATTLGVRHGLVILDAQQYHSGGCLVGGTSVKGGIVFERVLICYGPVGNISASSGLFILLDMAR